MFDPASEKSVRSVALGWVLAGIAAAFAAGNLLLMLISDANDLPDLLELPLIGAWVFQPMLCGVWSAIGPGRLIIRVLPTIPCLMLLVAVPELRSNSHNNIQRHEFIALLIAAMAVFAATILVMLVARRFFGWRIERTGEDKFSFAQPFQFGTRYLLILITLFAVALGVTVSLKFGTPEPFNILGPNFVLHIIALGSAMFSLLLLPIVSIPLAVLTVRLSKTFVIRAVAFWLVMTVGVALFIISDDGVEDAIFYLPVIQLGAGAEGAIVALLLRWTGCRLMSRNRGDIVRDDFS